MKEGRECCKFIFRYAVYDYEYQTDDGRETSKLVFFHFVPDICPPSKKMIYASTKDSIKAKLDGVSKDFQVNDYDDLSMDLLRSNFH